VAVDIVMPKLSDTMEEGKILKWLKKVGDAITVGEVIAEVETDKADMELEASESGVLTEIKAAEGESAAVGAVIATVDGDGAPAKPAPARKAETPAREEPKEASTAEKPTAAPAAKSPPTAKNAPPGRDGGAESPPKASPAARALANERGIDLAMVQGSGPDGRIVSDDVEVASVDRARPAAPRAPQPARSPEASREAPVAERHELSRMRQSIARRMSEAAREIPHFAVTAEIDMSEAVRLKTALEKDGTFEVPVTYTHMVLKATARALTRHPRLNASYRDGALEVHGEINLGMAVSVEDGLIVPVLRHADERSLADIASEARRLVGQTKQGRFAKEDLSGGTFTVSNMGMLDLESFTAVINPPQAAILAVGSIKPRPVVRDGAVVVAHTMFVTVSCDHRIIDGVMAGRFLEELKRLLENPIGLVVG
jgi:pyruvate dehydrogenase E2 component (dihydrolipoyllysine-residue acetyltransferase)